MFEDKLFILWQLRDRPQHDGAFIATLKLLFVRLCWRSAVGLGSSDCSPVELSLRWTHIPTLTGKITAQTSWALHHPALKKCHFVWQCSDNRRKIKIHNTSKKLSSSNFSIVTGFLYSDFLKCIRKFWLRKQLSPFHVYFLKGWTVCLFFPK